MTRIPFESASQGRIIGHAVAAHDLGALEAVVQVIRSQPILDLGHALAALGCVNPTQVDLLRVEDPALLRSRSHELVDRDLVTD